MRRLVLVAIFVGACLRPSEEHVDFDREVGRAEVAGSRLTIEGGLGAIRELGAEGARVWAAAPDLSLRIAPGAQPFRLQVDNVLPDAQLVVDGAALERLPGERPTQGIWELAGLTGEVSARLAPLDADSVGAYRIAVLSDVQEAVGQVIDIFRRMNDDPAIRFVISSGDLSETGTFEQLDRFQQELEALDVPFYSTVGNHEVPGPEAWHQLYGPFTSFFRFRGVAFSLVDSSNATVDPDVHAELELWIDAHVAQPHLFVTHVPLLDPSGIRSGAFRSRNEAASLLNELAEGDVDALFFGHVHSYYAYDLAGVPSYISGGGGAIEEELDGISRHFLTVDLAPAGVQNVGLVRVE